MAVQQQVMKGLDVATALGYTKFIYILSPDGFGFEAFIRPDTATDEEYEAIDANSGDKVTVPPIYQAFSPTLH